METKQPTLEETQSLRRCVRELAALSTLSAAWSRSDVREVADGLCLVLCRSLPAALVYVRVNGLGGTVAFEVARTPKGPTPTNQTQEIGKSLDSHLKSVSPDQTPTIANPFGTGLLRLVFAPIGHEADCGVVVASSQQPDFPSQTDRLLLGVAANQAAIVLQQRRADEQVRRSEQELSDFFENAAVGFHWVGPEGTILRVNQAELDLLGYTRGEYLGHHIAEFHADHDVIEDILCKLGSGETLREYEARLRSKDGSIKHVLINSNVLWEDGKFIHTRCFTRDITDRKVAQEALQKQSEWLRVTLASIGDAVITTDTEGRVTSLNPVAESLTGWGQHEAQGMLLDDVFRIVSEQSRQPVENPATKSLREGRIIGLANHTVLIARDGTERAIDDSAAPIKDEQGNTLGVVLIFRDVTEARRAAEAKLLLSAIVDSSEDAIISKNLDGIIVSWNNGAERLYGYTAEEVVGKPLAMLVPPDHPDEIPEILEQLKRGDQIGHYETVRVRKDGSHVNVSLTISPVKNTEGTIIGASKIARDITKQKHIEQTTRFLADASATLAELTDYESTMQRIASLAVPSFADWCAVDVQENGAMRRLAVTHADTARVQLAHELFRRYPPNPSDTSGVMKVIRTGEPEWSATVPDSLLVGLAQDDEHLNILRQLGLKSYICVPLASRTKTLGVLTFVMAESGRSYNADDLLAAEDLASRAAIAIENASLLAELKESDHRKDEFLAILAHELRNPLAPVKNAVQILRAKGPNVPELQWAREVIDRQVQQMTHLVDDLLDVSRINKGKIELRKERVQLAAVMNSAVESSRPLIDKWGHELTLAIPPEPIYLEADLTRLSQVLLNLLNNAAKYTEQGGRIWLTAEREGDQVLIRVKDTGLGIPQKMLSRIFDMFTQVDRSLERSEGGLGIGLTLVQRLVELHGGTVTADSAGPGKGSEFIVRLPAASEAKAKGPRQAGANGGEVATSKRRILVVDDNRDAADSLAILLRMLGNEVHTAYDGLEAVGATAAFQPDVVLLDIGLPKLNGYDAARRIREQQKSRDTVLVALTGWGQEEDRRRSKEAGFNHHMTKPVEFDALQKLLAALDSPKK